MEERILNQIEKIIISGIVMGVGLILFKYIPMNIYGKDILFDASAHIVWMIFLLYIIWFFIDQNKTWRIPYLILSAGILIVVSIQRILTNNHNLYGLFLGFLIGIIGIGISQWRVIKNKIDF